MRFPISTLMGLLIDAKCNPEVCLEISMALLQPGLCHTGVSDYQILNMLATLIAEAEIWFKIQQKGFILYHYIYQLDPFPDKIGCLFYKWEVETCFVLFFNLMLSSCRRDDYINWSVLLT